MKNTLISCASAMALTGCQLIGFAPSVDSKVATNLDSVTTSMSLISACIELGSCAGKSQIAQVEDRYVEAYSNANLALSIAAKTETSSEKSQVAKSLLLAEIEECRDAVRRQYDAHRSFPSLQGAGLAMPTVVTCQLAADAATALSRL